jgi:hypothetical protein
MQFQVTLIYGKFWEGQLMLGPVRLSEIGNGYMGEVKYA